MLKFGKIGVVTRLWNEAGRPSVVESKPALNILV
jgi:hypothetical protein